MFGPAIAVGKACYLPGIHMPIFKVSPRVPALFQGCGGKFNELAPLEVGALSAQAPLTVPQVNNRSKLQ